MAFAVLVIAALACGSDNAGTIVGEATEMSSTPVPPKVETFKIGDIIEVEDHSIVLNSAEISGNVLHANFTIENKGNEDLAVSSILSFSAKDNEGSKLEQEMFDCGSSGQDGKILPGDRLKGDICWQGTTSLLIKIYYEASLLGSGAIVWEITE